MIWLERYLLREPAVASTLIFELNEISLETNLVSSKRFVEVIRRCGAKFAISHFGKGVSSFQLIKELQPDFVKIDANLIHQIQHDSANIQFVRMIIDVAHRLNAVVIAESVEDLDQRQALEQAYVDGIQGFLIDKPTKLQ